MSLLAIDTSGSIACVAIGDGDTLIAEYHFAHNMDLLRRLTPAIQRVLEDADLGATDLTAIIASLGPGSFTGLRIGITAAKTLSWSLDIPIVGIGTLDALAASYHDTRYDYICPMVHSRKGECYWSLEDSTGAQVLEPAVSEVEEISSQLSRLQGSVICCGSGAVLNREVLQSSSQNISIAPAHSAFVRGAVLLQLGYQKILSGGAQDPLALAPIYIKKPTPVILKESESAAQE